MIVCSDVSRISEISITAYLRNVSPNAPANQGDENANMGNSDLCLGSVRFTPNLESMVSMQEGDFELTEQGLLMLGSVTATC
jgi:hypothetical protein